MEELPLSVPLDIEAEQDKERKFLIYAELYGSVTGCFFFKSEPFAPLVRLNVVFNSGMRSYHCYGVLAELVDGEAPRWVLADSLQENPNLCPCLLPEFLSRVLELLRKSE